MIYKARPPKQVWDDDLECEVDVRHIVTIEEDDGEPTGILDASGNELHRYVKTKMGFI